MNAEPTKEPVDSRKEVIELLKDLQIYFGTYHHHKESMGWAGVALFAVLMAAVATVIRQSPLQSSVADIQRLGFSIVVIVIWAVCLFYVHRQFFLRKRAGDFVSACIHLRCQVISTPSIAVIPNEWAPPDHVPVNAMQSAHDLPKVVITAASNLSSTGQSARMLLERSAYAILCFLAASLLAAIWIVGR